MCPGRSSDFCLGVRVISGAVDTGMMVSDTAPFFCVAYFSIFPVRFGKQSRTIFVASSVRLLLTVSLSRKPLARTQMFYGLPTSDTMPKVPAKSSNNASATSGSLRCQSTCRAHTGSFIMMPSIKTDDESGHMLCALSRLLS